MAKQNAIIRTVIATDYTGKDDTGGKVEGSIPGAYTVADLQARFDRLDAPVSVDSVEYHVHKYKMTMDDFIKYATRID